MHLQRDDHRLQRLGCVLDTLRESVQVDVGKPLRPMLGALVDGRIPCSPAVWHLMLDYEPAGGFSGHLERVLNALRRRRMPYLEVRQRLPRSYTLLAAYLTDREGLRVQRQPQELREKAASSMELCGTFRAALSRYVHVRMASCTFTAS